MKRIAWLTALLIFLGAGCGQREPGESGGQTTSAAQDAAIQKMMDQFDRPRDQQSVVETDTAPDFDPRPHVAGGPDPAGGSPSQVADPNAGTLAEVSLDDSVAPAADPRLLAAAEARQPDTPQAGPTVGGEPLVIPKAERGRDGKFDISFDHIKFGIEKDAPFDRSLFTDQVERLFGERIRIRGYIHPSGAFYDELNQFVLVRDNQECCFGPGAALYDCIMVRMAPGRTANYTVRPITVEGVFRFNEMKDPFDETKTVAIFEMQANSAQ